MQDVDFDYEVVIGEDHGTDNTRVICENYASKYPQVRLLPLTENLGVAKNWRRVLSECTGEYIAMCEGDDYWTDSLKLQKQLVFMESDKEERYVMCFHEAMLVDENGDIVKEHKMEPEMRRDISSEELRKGLHPSTQTVLFRQKWLPEILPLMLSYKWNCNDTLLFSLLGKYGNAGFLSTIKSSAWRIHSDSVWSSASQLIQNLNSYHTYKLMQKLHPKLYSHFVEPTKTKCARVVEYSAKEKRIGCLFAYLSVYYIKCIKTLDISSMVQIIKCVDQVS